MQNFVFNRMLHLIPYQYKERLIKIIDFLDCIMINEKIGFNKKKQSIL